MTEGRRETNNPPTQPASGCPLARGPFVIWGCPAMKSPRPRPGAGVLMVWAGIVKGVRPQPSTFTVTLVTLLVLGALTQSSPSR